MVPVSMTVSRGAYANSCQRGLFVVHGRSFVYASISEAEQVVVLLQFSRLVVADRLSVPPPGNVRVPLGGPSIKGDWTAPEMMRFQSGTVSRSCITRSTPASAAYIASPPSR